MSTFNIEDICFMDSETKSLVHNVKTHGTYRYFDRDARIILLPYAIGTGPVQLIECWGRRLFWTDLPWDLQQHWHRANQGAAYFAAWNAGFDKAAWNLGSEISVEAPIAADMMIDVMCQATASNMPPSLEGSSVFIGGAGKQKDGKALLKLFCLPGATATPESHPVEWERLCAYAIQDVDQLREVFTHTRQLPIEEWEEYWAAERVNERGMGTDTEFAEKAAAVARLNEQAVNDRLTRLTNGQITKVTQHQRIADWLWDNVLDAKGRDILVAAEHDEEDPEDEEETITWVKVSAAREKVTRLITFYEALKQKAGEWQPGGVKDGWSERDELVLELLKLREFGASNAPKKFQKMLDQEVGGSLYGQYVFNGAGQTGRFSAKGVQVHNLTRDVLGKKGCDEAAVIEMINDLEI